LTSQGVPQLGGVKHQSCAQCKTSQGVPQLGGVKHQSCAQCKTDRQTLLPVDNGPLSVSSVDSFFSSFWLARCEIKATLFVSRRVCLCVCVCPQFWC